MGDNLTEWSRALLNEYAEKDSLSLVNLSGYYKTGFEAFTDAHEQLREEKFIKPLSIFGDETITVETQFSITEYGRAYLENHVQALKDSKIQKIRLFMGDLISIIALVISIIALMR